MQQESVLNNSKYVDIIRRMIESSTGSPMVTEKNVYQEGNPTNKPLLRQIVQDVMLRGSRIIGREHLRELHSLAQEEGMPHPHGALQHIRHSLLLRAFGTWE